jgi:hypothetical protein
MARNIFLHCACIISDQSSLGVPLRVGLSLHTPALRWPGYFALSLTLTALQVFDAGKRTVARSFSGSV